MSIKSKSHFLLFYWPVHNAAVNKGTKNGRIKIPPGEMLFSTTALFCILEKFSFNGKPLIRFFIRAARESIWKGEEVDLRFTEGEVTMKLLKLQMDAIDAAELRFRIFTGNLFKSYSVRKFSNIWGIKVFFRERKVK